MGGRIYTTINGNKYEVIFGTCVVKFISLKTNKPRAVVPVKTPVTELKNYL